MSATSPRPLAVSLSVLSLVFACSFPLANADEHVASDPDVMLFLQLASPDRELARAAEATLTENWRDGYTPILIDLVRFLQPAERRGGSEIDLSSSEGGDGPGASDFDEEGAGRLTPMGEGGGDVAGDPGSPTRRRLIRFLEKRTGQHFGEDLDDWRHWMWSRPYEPHPDYAAFKGGLYGNVDPRMRAFFPPAVAATIRLDQVDWGGVRVNGIPPLDHPRVVSAAAADYLKDKHVVFGVEVNGEARAYPQRILAWHEMALDRVGGVELTVVYCALCGTVIPYDSTVGGKRFTFGTSGLLYRSNKLMFDAETRSLWSTVYGMPVVGPLAGSDIRLSAYPVVTTSWAEWRAAHPDTTVLSLDTGYERDYREGAAYRDYFRDDRLMFAVDRQDGRLHNKDEVLVIPAGGPLAIAVKRLAAERLLTVERNGERLLVATSPGGASRVYRVEDESFAEWAGTASLRDAAGRVWTVTEDALVSEDGSARRPRVPAHRSFWFAWYAHFPDAELIE
jgi:hypothetical protein